MESFRTFLDQSWASLMSREHMDYYPFGNTSATDFLYDLDLGSHLDILLIAAGDIRNILKTVSGLENREHEKTEVKKLRFVVNDCDADVLARDILLLEIINNMDVDNEDDLDFLWGVWYNIELLPRHHERLMALIHRVGEGNFTRQKIWRIHNKKSKLEILTSLKAWGQSKWTVEDMKEKRLEALSEKNSGISIDLGNSYTDPAEMLYGKEEKMHGFINCFTQNTVFHAQRLGDNVPDISEIREYYTHGSADPHYGDSSKQWTSKGRKPNPTIMKSNSTKFLADLTTSPFISYIPFDRDKLKEDTRVGAECTRMLQTMLKTFKMLVDKEKLQLSIDFVCQDAVSLLTSNEFDEDQFDYIDTSNLCDHTHLLTMLLTCQPHLKQDTSVLRTESILWRFRYESIEDFMKAQLHGLYPLLFPTVLGLRLAENFEFGQTHAATELEKCGNDNFRFKEEIRWVKCQSEGTKISFAASEKLKNFIKVFAEDAFKSKASKEVYILFKLLERLGSRVQDGVCHLLDVVEPLVGPTSVYYWQWQTYLAVFGYNTARGTVLKVQVSISKLRSPPRVYLPSIITLKAPSTKQVILGVKPSPRTIQFLILREHWDVVQMNVIMAYPNTSCSLEIDVSKGFEILQSVDYNGEVRDSQEHRWQELDGLRFYIQEDIDNYKISFESNKDSRVPECKVKENMLVFSLRSKKQKFTIPLSCAVQTEIPLDTSGEEEKIVVNKERKMVTGQMLLPRCQIKFTRLDKFQCSIESFTQELQVIGKSLCLKSDAPLMKMLMNEDLTPEQIKDDSSLFGLRIACHVMLQQEKVLCCGNTTIHLLDHYWYNGMPVRKVMFQSDNTHSLASSHPQTWFRLASEYGTIHPPLRWVSKHIEDVVRLMLQVNAQRVNQDDAMPGMTASFVQFCFPRCNIPLINLKHVMSEKKDSMFDLPTAAQDKCKKCMRTSDLKKCTRCEQVKYCSKQCQATDWESHKNHCKSSSPKSSFAGEKKGKEKNKIDKTKHHSQTKEETPTVVEAQEHKAKQKYRSKPGNTNQLEAHQTLTNCAFCKIKASIPRHICSRCNTVSYCSLKCRYDDLAVHKDKCGTNEEDQKELKSAEAQPPTETDHKESTTQCSYCDSSISANPHVCSKCYQAVYCSPLCEQQHWPQHWKACIQASLQNITTCSACKHSIKTCPQCHKVSYCQGDCWMQNYSNHQCDNRK